MFESLLFPRVSLLWDADNGAGSGGSGTSNATPPGNAGTGQNTSGGSQTPPPPNPANPAHTGQNGGAAGNQQQQGQQTPPADQNQQPPADAVSMPRAAFNERIEAERRAGVRELLKALGFESVETPEALTTAQTEMRGLLDYARQQRQANMTAEERAKEQIDTVTARATKAEGQVTTLTAERDQARTHLRAFVQRSVIVEAAAQATYPDDVYAWILREKPDDVAKIIKADVPLFKEDGTLNADAIDKDTAKNVVVECQKARREWFRTAHVAIPSSGNAQPPVRPGQGDRKQQIAAENIKL